MSEGYSHRIEDIEEHPFILDEELEGYIREMAVQGVKRQKIAKALLDAYFVIEAKDVLVTNMITSSKIFFIIRRELRDQVDFNTDSKSIKKGLMGMIWCTNIWVKKEFEGLELFSEDSSDFKERFPEFQIE